MTTIHEDRNGCALHGGLRLLSAIDGVVPILHANAGCSIGARRADSVLTGSSGANFKGWLETSSTNLMERHVVFGGTSRLREQIKNTLKVLDGDLYVVITGCVPEIVGDDVPAMVKEAREQRFPVIGIATPGFKGNGYQGYATVLRSLIEQLPAALEALPPGESPDVNLLGAVPGQDAFWEGDLLEVERAIGRLGLGVNRLVGFGQGIADWQRVPHARLNVVLSPWGLEAAQLLEARYGTPYVDLGWLPVGSRDLGDLLGRIGGALGVAEAVIAGVLRAQDAELRHFLQKVSATYLLHGLQKRVSIVGNAAYAVGLARFLSGTFGQIVAGVVITDGPPEASRTTIEATLRGTQQGSEPALLFSDSSDEIAGFLRAQRQEVILGSALEERVAGALGVPLLEIAAPYRDGPVLRRSYVGVGGAVTLVEDYSAAILRHQHARAGRLGAPVTVLHAPSGERASPCGQPLTACGSV